MKTFERLQQEEKVAEREAKRLRDYAWDASNPRRLERAPFEVLRQAAALRNHEGELGAVGRAAFSELQRRGFKL